MSTGHELIEAALRKISRLSSGESATTAERADGVLEANRMLGKWSAKIAPIYAETAESLTWASGAASRTIGTSGNLNTSRPQQILSASLTIDSIEHPLTIITHQDYQAIPDKTTTGTIPTHLAYNPTNSSAQGSLYIYPVPSAAVTLLLTSIKPMAALVGASDVGLPPGYEDAIVLNLAVRFADGDYRSPIPQSLRDEANDALIILERQNDITEEMYPDPTAPGMSSGLWNALTDEII